MEEDIIRTADVLQDMHRLPFLGYSLEIEHDEDKKTLRGIIKLSTKGQPETVHTIFERAVNEDTVKDIERTQPLIEAMLDYVNVGGDLTALSLLADDVAHNLSELTLDGFEFVTLDYFGEREVYYRDKLNQIVQVTPGVNAEIVTEEQMAAAMLIYPEDEDDDAPTDCGTPL